MKVAIVFEIPDAVMRAVPVVAIAVVLTAWLLIRMRRRRKRERAERLMTGIRHDLFPPAEHSAIEEIRREVDASHRRYERQLLEEDWKRDGGILLEKRKRA